MKSKFHISLILIGIVVAICCLLVTIPKSKIEMKDMSISYKSSAVDAFTFKTLPILN